MANRIVIIGGGVIGSSIAYHLRKRDPGTHVVVVERDSTYRRASSRLAMGGIRQQFSSRANIQLAQHSVRFYKRFDAEVGPFDTGATGFQQRGYLFLVNDAMADHFEQRVARQIELGAHVARIDVEQIRRLVPDLVLDDIRFGVFGPQDGYANPRAVLAAFRHAATVEGAHYLSGEVTKIERSADSVAAVQIESGDRLDARIVVNAAGAFAGAVGRMAEIDIPVEPVRQQLFRCTLPHVWPYRFPVVIDPTGVHWRHEDSQGAGDPDRIVIAHTKADEAPGENFACDMTRWAPDFRDPLVARMPALAEAKMVEGWAGLYEMTADHNPLLGEHPNLRRFYVAAGFSGHGLMMAPGAGLAMAELILTSESSTLDISPFAPTRFARDEPMWDEAMI